MHSCCTCKTSSNSWPRAKWALCCGQTQQRRAHTGAANCLMALAAPDHSRVLRLLDNHSVFARARRPEFCCNTRCQLHNNAFGKSERTSCRATLAERAEVTGLEISNRPLGDLFEGAVTYSPDRSAASISFLELDRAQSSSAPGPSSRQQQAEQKQAEGSRDSYLEFPARDQASDVSQPEQPSAPPPPKLMRVRLSVHYRVHSRQMLCIGGSQIPFGWSFLSISKLPMIWNEGDVWTAEVSRVGSLLTSLRPGRTLCTG